MIGVVLAAHGDVATALLRAAEAIVGPIEAARAVSLVPGAGPEGLADQLREAVQAVDQGEGVLILADMFGGTPANVCLGSELGAPVEVVTGANLPMVVKVASARHAAPGIEALAAQITGYGQRHITHATELMRERRRADEEARQPPARPAAAAPVQPVLHR